MQIFILLKPPKMVSKTFGKIKRLVHDIHAVHSMLNSVQDAVHQEQLIHYKSQTNINFLVVNFVLNVDHKLIDTRLVSASLILKDPSLKRSHHK